MQCVCKVNDDSSVVKSGRSYSGSKKSGEKSERMVQMIMRFRSILYASVDVGEKVTMNRP